MSIQIHFTNPNSAGETTKLLESILVELAVKKMSAGMETA